MTTIPTDMHASAIADATKELSRLLKEGTPSEQLMRLYALREIVARLSPEMLLKAAANFNTYFPDSEKEAA